MSFALFFGGAIINSLGFSNIIVSDNNFCDSHLDELFDFLVHHGFKRIVFTLDHDVLSTPISFHIAEKKRIYEKLTSHRPRGVSVWLESNIVMSKDSIYEKQIARLSIKPSKYLFCDFPIFDGEDWIDSTLNHLLYKQRKFPCFMSFEKNIATYPPEFVKHIATTRCACFMLDINSFAVPEIIPFIDFMIDSNSVIIPGFCGVIEDYLSLPDKLAFLKENIGGPNFTKLVVNSSKTTSLLLGL